MCLALASAPGRAHAAENALFNYTHLLPGPYTLPAGTLAFGTTVSFGVTDFLQVGTNVVSLVNGYINANAKVSLLDFEQFALAATVGYTTYNLQDIDVRNPDATVTAWQPGIVTAYGLLDTVALFVGGQLEIEETEVDRGGVTTSGFVSGAVFEADLSFAYNPPSRGKGIGNVLSAGVSYDVSYDLIGIGVSHHWPGFHFGFHYYPAADRNQWLPIIVGGGSVQL